MAHPLDGARLKVVRAQEHLEALKDEIGRYLDSHPHEFPVKYKSNEVHAEAAVIKTEPPLRLSNILGDCVSNLRSALDYVAWQLVTRHCPAPLTKRQAKRIYFPISTSKNKADLLGSQSYANLALHGVPAPALDLIGSVQPYHAGYGALETLSLLVNEDKHRLPLLTVAFAHTASMQILVDGEFVFGLAGCMIRRGLAGEKIVGGLAGIGTTLPAPDPALPSQSPRDVKVEGQVTVFVALQDPTMPREPVDRTIGDVVECVANIIPRFDPFV